MTKAVLALEERGEAVTARAVAAAANISLNTACSWLRQREASAKEASPMLSVLQYSPYSTPDTMPAVDHRACNGPPESTLAPVDVLETDPASQAAPRLSLAPAACPAASHQLLWHWSAGAWQCPACGM
jgi:hypothetical protein